MIAILAKDYNQFIDYLAVNLKDYPGDLHKDYMYASSAAVLRGVKLSDYIVIDTFYEREDAREILDQAYRSKMPSTKESKVPETKAVPNYERTIVRGIIVVIIILLSSIVVGIGSCVSFDRQMEKACMERGGSYNGIVGCYQPMPMP